MASSSTSSGQAGDGRLSRRWEKTDLGQKYRPAPALTEPLHPVTGRPCESSGWWRLSGAVTCHLVSWETPLAILLTPYLQRYKEIPQTNEDKLDLIPVQLPVVVTSKMTAVECLAVPRLECSATLPLRCKLSCDLCVPRDRSDQLPRV